MQKNLKLRLITRQKQNCFLYECIDAQEIIPSNGTDHVLDGKCCTVCGAIILEAECADLEYVMPEGDTRHVSVGREGKTLEATNYPSGDAFVYFMSYADTVNLTFYVNASKAGKATISVCMGCSTFATTLENLFAVKVNGLPYSRS